LDEWEKKHKMFIADLSTKNELLEDVIKSVVSRLLVIKVEIRDFKVSITDSVNLAKPKIITLKIEKIISYGCDTNWQEVSKIENSSIGFVNRMVKIIKLQVLILKDNEGFNLEESKY